MFRVGTGTLWRQNNAAGRKAKVASHNDVPTLVPDHFSDLHLVEACEPE